MLLIKPIDDSIRAKKTHLSWAQDLLLIVSRAGERVVKIAVQMRPWGCELESEAGCGVVTFGDSDRVPLEWKGEPLLLLPQQPVSHVTQLNDAQQVIALKEACRLLRVTALESAGVQPVALSGSELKTTSSVMVIPDARRGSQRVDLCVEPSEAGEHSPTDDMNTLMDREKSRLAAMLAKRPRVPVGYEATADFAWLAIQSAVVDSRGCYRRWAILSEKNSWLTRIWGWDNCFAALAVAGDDLAPEWDQVLLFADHQTPFGQLPDSLGVEATEYLCVKPPVYGWTILQLIERHGVAANRPFFEEAYAFLPRLFLFWTTLRDPAQTLTYHFYHGNDSGWDNATVFDAGVPVQGADLAAWLIVDSDCLAFLADQMGRSAEAESWRHLADRRLEAFMRHFVHNNRIFSPPNRPDSSASQHCLVNLMPVILSRRLPADLLRQVVATLPTEGGFLTPFGLVSESLRSPDYQDNGYWHGPIWALPNLIVATSLLALGEKTLALSIAQRFCEMINKDLVMSENDSANDGRGLRCPAITWTACVFLLLAGMLVKEGAA